MMYAIANLMEQGRLADANALSDHLAGARGQLSASLYIWSARDQISRINRRLPVAFRTGDWDAVIALLREANLPAGDKTPHLHFLAAELTDYASGMKSLEANDVAAAQAASVRMDEGLAPVKQEEAAVKAKNAATSKAKSKDDKDAETPKVPISPDALSGPLLKCLEIASLELHAGILTAQGKLKPAKKIYAEAALKEKKIGYHEPPFYIRPVTETEAAALLRAKDYAGAQAAYESALLARPNSGFGLYGLALTKELSGNASGARDAYQSFLKAWPAADSTLPEVAHARKVTGADARASR
jgi:tetratricopeptide (TPR) repeat protein